MPAKPKAVYIYPLQIWLTSAVVGPIFLFMSMKINDHSLLTFVQFYWVAALVGFALSFPSFLLLLAAVVIIDWHSSRIYAKKLVISCWAMALTISPFFLILGRPELILQKTSLAIVGSYVGPLLASVFLFRWPNRE